jgi:hypothetical protein
LVPLEEAEVRGPLILSLACAVLAVGCTAKEHFATAPQQAVVQFDSLTSVYMGGRYWEAIAVTNVGQSEAYQVKAYWHFTGDDSAQVSLVQPPDLAKGQTGVAATEAFGAPAWTYPSTCDSVRWSDSP